MKKGKKIIGMPVISLQTGEQIGSVLDLVMNSPKGMVSGLLLERSGWIRPGKAVYLEDIHSFGEDVITVSGEGVVKPVNQPRGNDELYRDGQAFLNLHMITESGNDLGIIEDILFDESSGNIEGYEVSNGLLQDLFQGRVRIPRPPSFTVGKEAVIVPDGMADYFQGKENGKQEIPEAPEIEWGEEIEEGQLESDPDEMTDW